VYVLAVIIVDSYRVEATVKVDYDSDPTGWSLRDKTNGTPVGLPCQSVFATAHEMHAGSPCGASRSGVEIQGSGILNNKVKNICKNP